MSVNVEEITTMLRLGAILVPPVGTVFRLPATGDRLNTVTGIEVDMNHARTIQYEFRSRGINRGEWSFGSFLAAAEIMWTPLPLSQWEKLCEIELSFWDEYSRLYE